MAKQPTHIRVGNVICPVNEKGFKNGNLEALSSVNAAKRRSKELQSSGFIVRLGKRIPPEFMPPDKAA